MIARRLTRAAGRIAIAAVLGAASAVVPNVVIAQQANPPVKQFGPRVSKPARSQPPAPQVVASHGDWTVQCERQPAGSASSAGEAGQSSEAKGDIASQVKTDAGEDSEQTCGMIQTARHEQRKNVALTLVLVKGEQQGKEVTMMRVMAPIGVFLPTGVALEIDGEAVGRVPFTRCVPQMCIAFAEASAPTLEKLKKGGKANFIIYEAPGLGMSMQMSLKGFTAALAELAKH